VPYFDHNATTPLAPVARQAWGEAADDAWQNPSSPYRAGARVGVRLKAARERLATLLGCPAKRIVFTGGATEAAHGIARHLAQSLPTEGKVAVSSIEHPCVIEALRSHFTADRLVWLPVAASGAVSLEVVEAGLATDTWAAVWLMAANNETGVMQPWAQVAAACRQAGVALVCDASQWVGKLSIGGLVDADWIFAAAHKFGGPKGMGFLLRPAAENGFVLRSGGAQEAGQRAGTEDFAGITAMVAALIEAETKHVLYEEDRVRQRTLFENEIAKMLPGCRVLGAGEERLWNTVSLILPAGAENHRWVTHLDKRGYEVSTGSACSSGSESPSHVLAAMGVPGPESRRVLRLSAGWSTTPADWRGLADALVEVAAQVKPADNVISIE
jgi:cysteine desulfurase